MDPIPANQLEERLESAVYAALGTHRSIRAPAARLSRLSPRLQRRFLDALDSIAGASAELGYHFCYAGQNGLQRMDECEWRAWTHHLLDRYRSGGVIASVSAMNRGADFVADARHLLSAVRFDDVAGLLERVVTGLNGRSLRLETAEEPYTDTETLFLPVVVNQCPDRDRNFQLCKSMLLHLWAQTWFGTWRVPLDSTIKAFPDTGRALARFQVLEVMRLDACVARELPGAYRVLRSFQRCNAHSAQSVWRAARQRLAHAQARVEDCHRLLADVYRVDRVPPLPPYAGRLHPRRTEAVRAARLAREKAELGERLAGLGHRGADHAAGGGPPRGARFEIENRATGHADAALAVCVDGRPAQTDPDTSRLLQSIYQDLGEIPDPYLEPGDALQQRGGAERVNRPATAADPAALRYDEWDYVRQDYRKGWCSLRERDGVMIRDGFVAATLRKHRGLLKHVLRLFEALRHDERTLRRQPDGDGIDIDAAIADLAELRMGREGSQRLFIQRRPRERDVAVLFMVDMSGSTKGWVNDLARESLVLLCESLDVLRDRYAIYGFSGFTHRRCESFRVKCFADAYDDDVRARISGIRPHNYTRMGVAIRHLSSILSRVEARTRILVTLTDGRPDDHDGYDGVYGIEDTRRALIETRQLGIHPFCITIDEQGLDYLPRMYGPANFVIVNRVETLPFKVSDIYRRLTT